MSPPIPDVATRQPPPGEGAMVLPTTWPDGPSAAPAEPSSKERRDMAREDRERFRHLMDSRRRVGYGVAVVGFGLLVSLGLYSFRHLQELGAPAYALLPAQTFWLLVAGHAVVTVAFVFLGYQLLRASERLILPYWWAESNPEITRLMLGMADPLSAATQSAERAVSVVEKVADPLIGLAQRISNGAPRNNGNG